MGNPRVRLYLVRHGVVEPEWRGRLYGDLDVPLSAEGRQQALQVAERLAPLRIHALRSSDLERARYGAECLANGRDLTPESDRRLRELSRGEWAGRRGSEVEALWPGALANWRANPGTLRPPGGESLGDLSARVLAALDDLAAQASEAAKAQGEESPCGAAVAHGWVLRCAALAALGLPPVAAETLVVPPAAVLVLDWPLQGHLSGPPVLSGLSIDAPLHTSTAWYRF